MSRLKIGIIGGGVAGLALAARQAAKGNEVHLYEAEAKVGGKLNELRWQGYRFDMGPSLFTMPQLLEQLFSDCGESLDDYLSYDPLPVVTRYFWQDGTALNAYADPNRFGQEVEERLGEPKEKVLHFLQQCKKYYEITADVFLFSSLHQRSTYLRGSTLKSFLQIPRLPILGNMHQANKRKFSSQKLVQLFDRYATYNGSSPYQAPALLNVIAHLENNLGAYFPREGMRSIAKALYALGKDKGVNYHLNSPIQEIDVENGLATGVKVAGKYESFDKVVCNMDVNAAYRRLLPNQKAPKVYLDQPKSSSAIIFYWAIEAEFAQLDLHNIFFSDSYEEEFNCLFKKKTLHSDLTAYLFISKKLVVTDAPEGCENWFVMVNAPANEGQDWDALVQQARAQLISKLSSELGADISKLIKFEHILDPRGIESATSSFQGALYGNSSNNMLAAFLRHPNFSSRLKNLFFCGGSVHPGGGIPLCLSSASIVDGILE